MTKNKINALAGELTQNNILVVGDILLDCYKYGYVQRLSGKESIPSFKEKSVSYKLGGVGSVAKNLRASGQNVEIISVVGNDNFGDTLRKMLTDNGISDKYIFTDKRRMTAVKCGYYVKEKQLFRADTEDNIGIDSATESILTEYFNEAICHSKLVVISDFAKGAVTESFANTLIQCARKRDVKVIVETLNTSFAKYAYCDLIKFNQTDFLHLTGNAVMSHNLRDDCAVVCQKNHFGSVVVKDDCNGLYYYQDDKSYGKIGVAESIVQADSNVGDALLSYLATGLVSGLSLAESAELASCVTEQEVKNSGSKPASLFGLQHVYGKVISADQLAELKKYLANKKIVFTNGCYDIFHSGHVANLQTASQFGDVLVVGINSDCSIKKLKGASRPICDLESRIKILEALSCVDYIVPFDDITPIELIRALSPDVYVKGADYNDRNLPEAEVVESNGGVVKFVPIVEGVSTTGLIKRIKDIE